MSKTATIPDVETDDVEPREFLRQLEAQADEWPGEATLKPARPLFELLREEKEAAGQEWNEYLAALYLDAPPATPAFDADAIADAVAAQVDASGDVHVDTDDLAAAVVRQFDYAELARKTADEIEGIMR